LAREFGDLRLDSGFSWAGVDGIASKPIEFLAVRKGTGNGKNEIRGFLRSAAHKCVSSSGRNDDSLLGRERTGNGKSEIRGFFPFDSLCSLSVRMTG
jgi:hypothetical protein